MHMRMPHAMQVALGGQLITLSMVLMPWHGWLVVNLLFFALSLVGMCMCMCMSTCA